jgi:hypothetical protein
MTPTMQEIIALSRQAKAVMDRYTADEKRLYDRRGFERFPAEEHKKRIDDLKLERNEALRSIEARANEIAAEASREAEQARNFVPMEVLDGLQRNYAHSHKELVEADVASLSESELAERLEGVLRNSSSPGERFLYVTLSKKRQREIVARRVKAAREAADGKPQAIPDSATRTAFDGPLRQLEKALLGPEAERRAARWEEIAREAAKVAKSAFLDARDAQSFAGVVAQRHAAREFAERQQREPMVWRSSAGGRIANATQHD